MLTRISNLRSISADSSVSSNDVRKIIFPTGSLTNNGSGTITLAFSGDGSSFTNLNAGNLASGTLADARLSSNIPLKNAANTFTNANTIAVSSPAIVNLILRGATSQTSDLLQIQDINSNMWIRFLGSSPAIDVAQSNGGVGQGYISLRTNSLINKAGLYRSGSDYFFYYSLATGDIVLDSIFGGSSGVSFRITGNEKVRVTSAGQLLINGFSSSTVGQVIKGAVSQTADLFQTQDSSGNILNSFTASGQLSFFGQSSTNTNRIQGAIKSGWSNSTDATRLGRMILYADNAGTLQNAIQIDAASSSPTTTIAGGFSVSSTGLFWSAYWGASFISNFCKHYYGQNGESITGSGYPNNSLHFSASGFQVGASGRDSYSHWFAGGAFNVNFGTIPVVGSPANYARMRIDPELFSAASAQTIGVAATLFIGSAPANATNLTITSPRAIHVNAGESYFGGAVKIGTGNIHFNNGAPIARPTLPAAGVVVASDIRTALINLGLCQ